MTRCTPYHSRIRTPISSRQKYQVACSTCSVQLPPSLHQSSFNSIIYFGHAHCFAQDSSHLFDIAVLQLRSRRHRYWPSLSSSSCSSESIEERERPGQQFGWWLFTGQAHRDPKYHHYSHHHPPPCRPRYRPRQRRIGQKSWKSSPP